MKSLLTKLGVTIAVLVMVALNAGCAKTVGGTAISSLYKVEYKTPNAEGLEVTVKGPAAKLAVILTNPSGQTSIRIIKTEDMISNCQTVTIPMENPQEGQWVLLVKTFDPETIVFRKSVPFLMGETTILSAYACLSPQDVMGNFSGYKIDSFQIIFQKTGDLPISISEKGSLIKINGRDCQIFRANIADLGNKVILILPLDFCSLEFNPNDKISIDARILLENGNKGKTVKVIGELLVPLEKNGKQFVGLSKREVVIPDSNRVGRNETAKKEITEAGVSKREAVILRNSRVGRSEAVKKEIREAIISKRQFHQSGETKDVVSRDYMETAEKKSARQETSPQEPIELTQGEVVSSPPIMNLRQLMTHKSDVQ